MNLPAYWITRRTPRLKTRWVFGAWLGREFADNPRRFALYVEGEHPDIEVVWLGGKNSVADARAAGLTAYRAYGLAGYWYAATAGLAVVSGGTSDVNRFVAPPLVFNLWHGVPLKRVEFDSAHVSSVRSGRRFLQFIMPFHEFGDFAAVAASSPREAEQLASAFRLPDERVHVTGQPRDDDLLTAPPKLKDRVVLYAPTFRDSKVNSPVALLVESLEVIERALADLDATLHVRLHPSERARHLDLPRSSRVLWRSELTEAPDTAMVLNQVDVLVTDYSSIYIDFLFTGRPIVFLCYDLENYLAHERGLYFEYEDARVTPGAKVADWKACVSEIHSAFVSDQYRMSRTVSFAEFVRHVDGQSSQRAYKVATDLMGLSS